MIQRLFPILVVVASNLIYHMTQKTITPRANVAASLVVTYAVSLVLSFALFFAFPPEEGLGTAFRSLNASSYWLGLGVVGVEVGFLLAYRVGWPLSLAAVYSSALLTILLVPIGLLFWRERLSLANVLGIVLSLAGIALMSLSPHAK
jgi:drug/metabolite transporter (DMT)-like permease